MRTWDPFSANKQKVREMDLLLLKRYFRKRKGELRYLGLPATTLVDLLLWKEYFAHFSAVERGNPGEEYRYHHDLVLTAMQTGLDDKLELFRGDIDDVLLQGEDNFGNVLRYPYDVVSLDYSGGLVYKDEQGIAKRPTSIQHLVREQAGIDQSFLLLLSCNLDNQDRGEITTVLDNVGRELGKLGLNVAAAVERYNQCEMEEARLKVYVCYLVGRLGTPWYQCEHCKPIFYEGNRGTRMMHFGTWLKRTDLAAGEPNRQTLVDILNLPVFQCVSGDLQEYDFGIPVVTVVRD